MKKTHIKTDLPGPKARELLARDALVDSPSYPRDYPFVMSHGKGAEIWDVDGNRFLDFAAGIAVCSTGHSHPAVVQAIKDAADRFLHISSDYWHEGQVRLAERMNELSPMKVAGDELLRAIGNRERRGGAQAGALRDGTRPLHRISRRLSRQNDGIAVVHVEQVHAAEGLLPDACPASRTFRTRTIIGRCSRARIRGGRCCAIIEEVLFVHNVPASEVAGILVEPIQGEGGYLVPPDGFLSGPARTVRSARHSADIR